MEKKNPNIIHNQRKNCDILTKIKKNVEILCVLDDWMSNNNIQGEFEFEKKFDEMLENKNRFVGMRK